MNTGIQDDYNLGWKLAWVLAGRPSGVSGLRGGVAAGCRLGAGHQLQATPGAAGRYRRGLRSGSAGRGAAPARHRLRRRRARPRHSPSHRPRASRRPRPRRLCRDAAGTLVRLDVFCGPHCTLLAFGARHADILMRVARPCEPLPWSGRASRRRARPRRRRRPCPPRVRPGRRRARAGPPGRLHRPARRPGTAEEVDAHTSTGSPPGW